MKLVTFTTTSDPQPRFGALLGGDVIDLAAADTARGAGRAALPSSFKAYLAAHGRDIAPLKAVLAARELPPAAFVIAATMSGWRRRFPILENSSASART